MPVQSSKMVILMKSEEFRLQNFLKKNKLKMVKFLAKGHSSNIYLVKLREKKFALKIEKDKSRRIQMLEKEVKHLKLANSVGIGPKLKKFDSQNKCVLMEFVKGKTLDKWLFDKPSKKKFMNLLNELFMQISLMDSLGLSHGQLARRGRNIIVRKNLPVIIDFEKSSIRKKTGNMGQIMSFLFYSKHSSIVKKVKQILY